MNKLSGLGVIFTSSIFVMSAAFAQPSNAQQSNVFSDQQKAAIKQMIHDELVNNPEILIEASQALQSKEQAQIQTKMMQAVQANKKELFGDAGVPSYSTGKNPTVTIVEFFDYQCIHCKNMAAILEGLVKTNKSIKISFREFPIFGADSEYAAKAALASVKQGQDKYYAFHNALFNVSDRLNAAEVDKAAQAAGLNVDQLHKDMQANDASLKQQLAANTKLAAELGIEGTPAFFIGGHFTAASATSPSLPTKFVVAPGEISQKTLQGMIDQVK